MLQQLIEPQWPAHPGVLAVCTTRLGGCSSRPFDSFNLGHHVGDSDDAVKANRELFARSLPGLRNIRWLTQVHGVDVVEASEASEYPSADGIWSRRPKIPCAVLTADCLPVLFCSAAGDVVAAAHAGWRGLLAGVIEATVEAMCAQPKSLLAWLGPAIGPGAFEVGPEVRDDFVARASGAQVAAIEACFLPSIGQPGHYFADLYALARIRLGEAGVTQVYGGEYCTYSEPERFYSYRRDGQTGRMASLIYIR